MDIIRSLLVYAIFFYVVLQLFLISNSVGFLMGRTRKMFRKLQVEKMYEMLRSELKHKPTIIELNESLVDLEKGLKNPFIYIWFSSYVKLRNQINILYDIRDNLDDLEAQYQEQKN